MCVRNGATASKKWVSLDLELDRVNRHLDFRVFQCEEVWQCTGGAGVYLVGLTSLDEEGVAHATVLICGAHIICVGPRPMGVLAPWGVWNGQAVALMLVGDSDVTTVCRIDTDNSNLVCLALSEVTLLVLPMILMLCAIAGLENWMRTGRRKIGTATEVHDCVCVAVGLWEAIVQEFEIAPPFRVASEPHMAGT